MTQYIHPVANKMLRTEICPLLRDDEVAKLLRYDELIIKFGNKLSEKHSSHFQHDLIRAELRLLARFVIELKKLEPQINELKDAFKPHLFDKSVQAIRTVAHWDDDLMGYKTPAVAPNLTSLIKKCAKKQRAELIKEGCHDLRDIENFLLLWEEEIPISINRKALEDQSNKKRVTKTILPSKEDIKKLYLYLKENITNAIETLKIQFCIASWTKLVQSTLIYIQIFNRRRAGEIERLTIENFSNREVITDNIDKDMLKNISENSVKFAKQFVRITLRGKLGRTVSVLLCPILINAIELILKWRGDAGITSNNNFIFSKPTTSKLSKHYFRACPLLKKFSEECGAQIPESLRGTRLRKHIATYISLLNVEEASIDRLANFMGHHKDIHKNIYRMSVPVAEVTCVSKLLLAAVGDEDEVEDAIITDDEVEEEENNEDAAKETEEILDSGGVLLQDSIDSTSSSNKKRRSKSPYGKTIRTRWRKEEREAIYTIFGDIKSLKNLPSLKECSAGIRKASVLTNRTPQQVKSWIDNQRRYNKESVEDAIIKEPFEINM